MSRADEGELTGHPDALRILLRNLLDNAIKYTPEGGVVDVEVHVGSGGTLLTIDDTGPGIPEADRKEIQDRLRDVFALVRK